MFWETHLLKQAVKAAKERKSEVWIVHKVNCKKIKYL